MAIASENSKLVYTFTDSNGQKFTTQVTEADPDNTETDLRMFGSSLQTVANGDLDTIQKQVNQYFVAEAGE